MTWRETWSSMLNLAGDASYYADASLRACLAGCISRW